MLSRTSAMRLVAMSRLSLGGLASCWSSSPVSIAMGASCSSERLLLGIVKHSTRVRLGCISAVSWCVSDVRRECLGGVWEVSPRCVSEVCLGGVSEATTHLVNHHRVMRRVRAASGQGLVTVSEVCRECLGRVSGRVSEVSRRCAARLILDRVDGHAHGPTLSALGDRLEVVELRARRQRLFERPLARHHGRPAVGLGDKEGEGAVPAQLERASAVG